MLVLMRRTDETILIGPDVRVTVIRVRGRQVTLGIEAPDNVEIWREELVEDNASEHRETKKDRHRLI
jgi:carbon storage regulator